MTCYSKKILDLFYNIQNSGRIIKPEAIGRAGSQEEGTVIEFSWRVNEGIIEDARFRTFGDVNAIAISSVITSMMTGRYVEDILSIKAEDVLEQLQDDKSSYLYLTDLALSALASTYENYLKRLAKSGKVSTRKVNEISQQLKINIDRLESDKEFSSVFNNFSLGNLDFDENEDEKQYLDTIEEYEKVIDEHSVENSLKELMKDYDGSYNFFTLNKTTSATKYSANSSNERNEEFNNVENAQRGRGRPRKEKTLEELEYFIYEHDVFWGMIMFMFCHTNLTESLW